MDYKNGKIYTLRSHQTDDIYIGSCATTLTKRKSYHKNDYNKWKNGKFNYITSYELIKYDDWYIELLEDFPCENRNQLEKREGELIRSMNCVNKNIAGRTKKEYHSQYRIENIDKIKEYEKQYRLENADKIKKYQKEYKIENYDEINEYQKEYRLENDDEIKKYQKEYRINNNEKNNCECGGKYTKKNLPQHQKTKRHQEYLETLATN
jgi:hypothetical protein